MFDYDVGEKGMIIDHGLREYLSAFRAVKS